MSMHKHGLAFILCFAVIAGCSTEEIVPEQFYPRNDHEAYQYALQEAGLIGTALGQEWLTAAKGPFNEPIVVKKPLR